jgi:hypothetical protein
MQLMSLIGNQASRLNRFRQTRSEQQFFTQDCEFHNTHLRYQYLESPGIVPYYLVNP